MQNPSLAGVLEHVVGLGRGIDQYRPGGFATRGVALLGLAVRGNPLCHRSGQDHAGLPEEGKNANQVPVNALWLTNVMIQAFLVITLFSASTYTTLIYLASSMILVPYLWSAAYAVLLSARRNLCRLAAPAHERSAGGADCPGYAIWLLYAGLKYLLLSALLYAPGVILFALAKREQGNPVYHRGKGIFSARDRGRRVGRVWAV